MIIDQNALDNLDFSLTSNGRIITDEGSDDISTLIKKYKIVKKTNHLIYSIENNYLFLANYVADLYYLDKPIPSDIQKTLKYDIEFKSFLLNDLARRLKSLVTNNSTLFFKEIGNIINLLSLGNHYSIFETYNKYDLDEVSKLFRDYESFLHEQSDNSELFDVTFNCYITLIESFTQLCVINSTDITRKKTIRPIIESLTETNNMLKFTVNLSEEKINKLNNILGKLLYYFAHIPYFEIATKTMEYIIDEFTLNLERLADGYTLSKDTNFGNNPDFKEKEFILFENNSAYLILTLIKKLESNFTHKDFFNSVGFKKLIDIYNTDFLSISNKKCYGSLEDFKRKLLDTLVFRYDAYPAKSSHSLTHLAVIDNFILADEDFHHSNLETIHNIILFCDKIQEYKYFQIISILTSREPIKNDYYVFFSIKIMDVIINKFIKQKANSTVDEYFKKIFKYIEINKTASQLLCMFTKIYLSLARYYSYANSNHDIKIAKEFYATFVSINGHKALKNEYQYINNEILINFGKDHINNLNLSENKYDKSDLRILGEDQINTYLKYNELELKHTINQEISNLTSQILNENNFDYEYINYRISHFISTKLFLGIASVTIKGLSRIEPDIEDTGYKEFSIPILDNYEILFIFPDVYEETFKYILRNNTQFIKQNVENILTGYKKNNVIYVDEITMLENISKLENDIIHQLDDITLVEISIPSLLYVNKKYGFETGNKFFRAISKRIESFIHAKDSIYRLSGARIGIILYDKNTYDQLIKKIFNFNVSLRGEEIDVDYVLAVTSGTKDDILTKSYQNVLEAITNNKSINIKI